MMIDLIEDIFRLVSVILRNFYKLFLSHGIPQNRSEFTNKSERVFKVPQKKLFKMYFFLEMYLNKRHSKINKPLVTYGFAYGDLSLKALIIYLNVHVSIM
jgi:hypothetical protein